MTKFSGKVGFGYSQETKPGVYEDLIVEHVYYGDVVRNTRRSEQGDQVNNDISTSNSISIVADPYASEHFFAMSYVEWAGTRWTILEVEVQSPRLLLRLGGVYHGPTP